MTVLTAGFDISYDGSINIVTLRFRGFWDVKLGEKFEREFQKKIKDICISGRGWHLLLDLTRYPPQLQEIQDIMGKAMQFAKQAGMQKKAVLVNGLITPFQTDSLIQDPELQFNFYFQSEDAAVRWLLNDQTAQSRPP